jgi:hypothetical protein
MRLPCICVPEMYKPDGRSPPQATRNADQPNTLSNNGTAACDLYMPAHDLYMSAREAGASVHDLNTPAFDINNLEQDVSSPAHSSSTPAHDSSTSVRDSSPPTRDSSMPAHDSSTPARIRPSTHQSSTGSSVTATSNVAKYNQTNALAMQRVAATKRAEKKRRALAPRGDIDDNTDLAKYDAALNSAASCTINIAKQPYNSLTSHQQQARNATSVCALQLTI